MTTGVITAGDPNGSFYSYRAWSGGDSPSRVISTYRDHPVRVYYYKNGVPMVRTRTRRIKRSVRAVARSENAYSLTVNSFQDTEISRPLEGLTFSFMREAGGYPDPYVEDPFSAWYVDLLNKVNQQSGNGIFNAGIALGEGRESLQTIADGATRIARFLRAIKKGNLSAAAKALHVDPSRVGSRNFGHDLSKNVLAFEYGWKPILNDVYNAAEAFAFLHEDLGTQVFSARRSKTFELPLDQNYYYPATTSKRRYRLQVVAKIPKGSSAADALGLSNPLSIAWELVPFSFVADWFIPIGNYLEARFAASSLHGVFIVTSSMEQWTSGCEPILPNNVVTGPPPYKHFFEMNRQITSNASDFLVTPSFKDPKDIFTLGHVKNALALLNNIL